MGGDQLQPRVEVGGTPTEVLAGVVEMETMDRYSVNVEGKGSMWQDYS